MIDLNHLLLFIAFVSPLILLGRIVRLRSARNRGWRIASLVVLGVCIVAWLVVPGWAGFIGGVFWALLLLVPSLAERRIDEWLLAQRLTAARRLAVVRQVLHPWDDSPYRPILFRCLEQARAGRLDQALDRLAVERAQPTPAGSFATALTFALTENWPGLLQWCRRHPALVENPAIVSLYLRALGETGAVDDLMHALAASPSGRQGRFAGDARAAFHFALGLAFGGRPDTLVRLMADELLLLPMEQRQFWLAVAERAAGKEEAGRSRLEKIRTETKDAVLRRSIERRLAPEGRLASLSPAGQLQLGRLMTQATGAPARNARGAPAVWALIFLNLAAFAVEMASGGSTNAITLHRLGALEPAAVVVRHEYWRLFTALFLHYGALHVAINLLGLYLLGPALERMIGAAKFVSSYLLCGLGSGLLVILLQGLKVTQSDSLVGASGCIMGVIGVSAGLLLCRRASALAGRQLRDILAIVAIQTVFDFWTPQVSLAAHLGGFLTGLILGIILSANGRRPQPA